MNNSDEGQELVRLEHVAPRMPAWKVGCESEVETPAGRSVPMLAVTEGQIFPRRLFRRATLPRSPAADVGGLMYPASTKDQLAGNQVTTLPFIFRLP